MKFFSVLVLSTILAGSARGEVRTVTASSNQPLSPIQSAIHYEIKCPSHLYHLMINLKRDDVTFKVDETNGMDGLATTPLGTLMRSKELFGRFGFACSEKGLSLTFLGFKIVGTAAPQAVEYQAVIGNEGQVLMNNGLQPTTLLFIQQTWLGN